MNNYKCLECNSIHSAKEWNDRTKIEYGNSEALLLIEDELLGSIFNCPYCIKNLYSN